MRTGTPYAKMAAVWDHLGQSEHSTRMVDYTLKIFRQQHFRPTTGLDLCCGTGTAIELFLKNGMIMSGLDGSPAMIAEAAAKLKGRGVRLYHKVLPGFRLLPDKDSRGNVTFDFVTSYYDSLNYLTSERDLKTTFRAVANHLNPGGYFVFDMNTPAALKHGWDYNINADVRDDIAWVWKSEYNPRTTTAIMYTTTFVKEGVGWRRFDENHSERAYSNTTLKRLLRESGFVVKGFYKCHTFEPPARDTFRICAVAKKK